MPWQRTRVWSLTRMLIEVSLGGTFGKSSGLDGRHGLLGGLAQVVRRSDGKPGALEDGLALLHVGALEPHDERHLEVHLLGRGDHALGDDVTLHDSTED